MCGVNKTVESNISISLYILRFVMEKILCIWRMGMLLVNWIQVVLGDDLFDIRVCLQENRNTVRAECASCAPCTPEDESRRRRLLQHCDAGYVDCDWLCNFYQFWPDHVTPLLSRMTESDCHYFETYPETITINEHGEETKPVISNDAIHFNSTTNTLYGTGDVGTLEVDVIHRTSREDQYLYVVKVVMLIATVMILCCVVLTVMLYPHFHKWHRSKHKPVTIESGENSYQII